DELLPAGVERVAVGADLDVDARLRRTSRELVAARAANVRLDVGGVDVGLHGRSSVAGQVARSALLVSSASSIARAGSTANAGSAPGWQRGPLSVTSLICCGRSRPIVRCAPTAPPDASGSWATP